MNFALISMGKISFEFGHTSVKFIASHRSKVHYSMRKSLLMVASHSLYNYVRDTFCIPLLIVLGTQVIRPLSSRHLIEAVDVSVSVSALFCLF
jgi:hypothetical protein